jgi:hypothetical protein
MLSQQVATGYNAAAASVTGAMTIMSAAVSEQTSSGGAPTFMFVLPDTMPNQEAVTAFAAVCACAMWCVHLRPSLSPTGVEAEAVVRANDVSRQRDADGRHNERWHAADRHGERRSRDGADDVGGGDHEQLGLLEDLPHYHRRRCGAFALGGCGCIGARFDTSRAGACSVLLYYHHRLSRLSRPRSRAALV